MEKNGWVAVKDRLPSESGEYYVVTWHPRLERCRSTCVFDSDTGQFAAGDCVFYWAPICGSRQDGAELIKALHALEMPKPLDYVHMEKFIFVFKYLRQLCKWIDENLTEIKYMPLDDDGIETVLLKWESGYSKLVNVTGDSLGALARDVLMAMQ